MNIIKEIIVFSIMAILISFVLLGFFRIYQVYSGDNMRYTSTGNVIIMEKQ